MKRLEDLNIDIFADGADVATIASLAKDPLIKGFTTNPTLMRKAGVKDYETWARQVLQLVPELPVSFEVLADDFEEMGRQARIIASWGPNVYVKIPVMNTKGVVSYGLIEKLSETIQLNVTALMVPDQIGEAPNFLSENKCHYVSIFAGRISDTGRDPRGFIAKAVHHLKETPWIRVIWASPRCFGNLFHAEGIGCHAITFPLDMLAKRQLRGKDLTEYSMETVQQFHNDAKAAGYTL